MIIFSVCSLSLVRATSVSEAEYVDVKERSSNVKERESLDLNRSLLAPTEAINNNSDLENSDFLMLDELTPEQDLDEGYEEEVILPWSDNYYAPVQRIKNTRAQFYGLDKISGNVKIFSVPIGQTYQFGSLQVTPKVCYTSAPTEPDITDAFVSIKVITLDNEVKSLFSGWMFANSPGINAVDHAVYDVWLKKCQNIDES
ncbi:DUF2155 domain-containing protein [Bartonella sp. DGB1]|uniref:DUF2155 domain-containing protein n=1 Tax=Bartonella sp. DGB1 TaxID=3239807 RepID=UPI003524877B